MVLTVHHLHISVSERIIWLCEELSIPYEIKSYDRVRPTYAAPPEYKALSSSQTAPVITDGDIVLAESAACIEYIIDKYGGGKLMRRPSSPDYLDFLFWWHYAQGSLAPSIHMSVMGQSLPEGIRGFVDARRSIAINAIDERLGKSKFLAGDEFTAADLITLFPFSTGRTFFPLDLTPYKNILRWLAEVGGREAYKRALEKGDPGFEAPLGAESPKSLLS